MWDYLSAKSMCLQMQVPKVTEMVSHNSDEFRMSSVTAERSESQLSILSSLLDELAFLVDAVSCPVWV